MTAWRGGMTYGLAAVLVVSVGAAMAGDWINPDGTAADDPEIGETARTEPRDGAPAAGPRESLPPPPLRPGDVLPRYAPGHVENSIPRGHLPPPGSCRLWYPDRPPGHQPPPGSCADLKGRADAGAYLIEG